MSDRELLELAAKAAAIEIHSWHEEMPRIAKKQNRLVYWNPLTDDGDALRLAVKLNLKVECYGWCTTVSRGTKVIATELVADRENDATAATRRAIVRAAAEIGKAQA